MLFRNYPKTTLTLPLTSAYFDITPDTTCTESTIVSTSLGIFTDYNYMLYYSDSLINGLDIYSISFLGSLSGLGTSLGEFGSI